MFKLLAKNLLFINNKCIKQYVDKIIHIDTEQCFYHTVSYRFIDIE